MIALAFILTIGCLVGCVKQEREKSRKAQTATSSTTKEDKETIKQKQLAYLKEHEQEIVDFVKAQNPKVETVQIDWDETQMSDGGLTTPEYYMNAFLGALIILRTQDGEWIFQLIMINQLTCEKCLCFMNLRLAESLFPK
mgnify:CR=1 FL=1